MTRQRNDQKLRIAHLIPYLWRAFGLLVTVAILLGLTAFFFPQQVLTVDSGSVKADALVVLGGTPDRAERAAELFKEGEAPEILVSGKGDCASNEKLLEKEGVTNAAIILESKSHTTRENAEFSIPLLRQMGAQRVIIVTSWYHSRRALACFEHYGAGIKFYSRPSYFAYPRAEWHPKRISGYVRSEYLKLLGYWVRYGVWPF
jgi:uncharacterized SAM-binding protein YcdF (DUF218 family)